MKLNIPEKYNREETEEKWIKYWEKEKIFSFENNSEKPIFSVDTPPPYVSAEHLHAGHIMSYAQAEFIVRYKRMRGFNVFYPMGFDDNGLPTERFVEKKYKIDKSKISKAEFVKICLKETKKGSENYKKLWNSLGISVDWNKTYSTISPLATKISQWSLIDLYNKGYLYRKDSPVLWCPYCQTAVSQADLEDKEEESKLNYIIFKTDKENLTIATTRPELLASCVALYINPNDKRYKHLIGKMAIVPLFDYQVPIYTNEKVDMEFGTGLMMVCTWGDKEDLEKWTEDKLNTRNIIKENGRLNELAGKYEGLSLKKARQEILNELKKQGYLIKQEDIKHTLNVHERCGESVEFIKSKQWFIKISSEELKKIWLKQGKKINWFPQSKFKIFEDWVNSLKWDWCISRQRYYGVPFPVWYCSQCQEPIFANEKELPVNPEETKPPVSQCPKCQNKEFIPEKDVLDTWATSSCTQFLIRELSESKNDYIKLYPPTLRPNAFEIIRTWDFYSIVKSFYNFNNIPFENLMISGHGLDEKGKKFSKRLGNYIPPEKTIKEYGADAFRYWATGVILGQNLRYNEEEIKKGKKTTIKIFNVAKFLIMNINDFDLKKIDSLNNFERLFEESDNWIISQLNESIKKTTEYFEKYEYGKARNEIDDFFWNKFTDRYIEYIKYRLNEENKESKLSAQYTLFIVFLNILKLYSPIIPFITEEIYQIIYKDIEKEKSIHLSKWSEGIEISDIQKKRMPKKEEFEEVNKAIDEIRKYKSEKEISLGKEIEEYILKESKPNLKKYKNFIEKVMRVKNLK